MATRTAERPTPLLTPQTDPLRIDEIRSGLRESLAAGKGRVIITPEDLRLIVDVLDAARRFVREWSPTASEKSLGCGTSGRMRDAEECLTRTVKTS
jgi:hypothetical protein